MSATDKLFTEKFRAKSLENMALLKRVKEALRNGLTQNILLYSTSGGTGKTTITRILAQGYDTMTINASAERGIDVIRERIQTFAGTYSIMGASRKKVIVLEEMDGLTADSFAALRAVIEKYADDVRFIGNCNEISKIPEPIQSRFLCIPLYPINQEEQAELFNSYCNYVKSLCNLANLSYTDDDISTFVGMYFPNMRTILNKLQEVHNSTDKVLNVKNLSSTFDCHKLYDLILDANKTSIDAYKLIVDEYTDDPEEIMRTIAREFLDYVHDYRKDYEDWLWLFAVKIADYSRTINQTIDKQVHLLGLIGELMILVKGV